MNDQQAGAYLAGLIDGEGCVWIGRFHKGANKDDVRRVVTIGMTDEVLIDFAAELFAQLGIGYSRSDRSPGGTRKHVWTIAVRARRDIERLAETVPIMHPGTRERLAEILTSYKTAKPYARRRDHKSPALAEIEPEDED